MDKMNSLELALSLAKAKADKARAVANAARANANKTRAVANKAQRAEAAAWIAWSKADSEESEAEIALEDRHITG